MNQKSRILIIDDDNVVHQSCTPEYEKLGYDVSSLEDGSGNIVEKVLEIKPDVIHLDLIMPGPSGFEVLRTLKSDERTKNIPVFVVSNIISFPEEVQKSLDLGAVDHISSAEFDPSEIAAKVVSHLQDRSV